MGHRRLYPLLADLVDRRCLVVGAGAVAAGKLGPLLDAGARVRLVAPEACERIAAWVAAGRVEEHRARAFAASDADGCLLAIAASDDPAVNRRVREEADRRGMLCNVATDPDLCSLVVPSVVRRGALTFAISTGGASPSLARHLRGELEGAYGPEWADLVDLLGELRHELRQRHPAAEARGDALARLLGGDVLARLREGDSAGARALARQTLELAA